MIGYAGGHRVTLGLTVALSIRRNWLCVAAHTQSQNHLGGGCRQENTQELHPRTSSENTTCIGAVIRDLPYMHAAIPESPHQLQEARCLTGERCNRSSSPPRPASTYVPGFYFFQERAAHSRPSFLLSQGRHQSVPFTSSHNPNTGGLEAQLTLFLLALPGFLPEQPAIFNSRAPWARRWNSAHHPSPSSKPPQRRREEQTSVRTLRKP